MLSTATNYLIHFPGVLHHPLEEVMADVVLASEPATTYMRGRLVREHSALATGAADFAARVSLQQLGRGSSVVDLRHAGVDFILAYGDHIQFEESQVLPMALDVLNETQWQDIRTKMISKHDPLFARDRLRLYDNLYDAVLGESAQIMSQPKH